MTQPYEISVDLWISPGGEAGFRRYEDAAFTIMRRHGAVIRDVRRPNGSTPDLPDEVHHIAFPDRASFDAYVADPELRAMSELRERSVARAQVTELKTGT